MLTNIPQDLSIQTLRSIFRQSFYAYFKGVASRTKSPNLASERTFKPLCDFYQDGFIKHVRALVRDPRNHGKTSIEMAFIQWLAILVPHPEYDSPAEFERATNFLKYHPTLVGVDGTYLFASGSEKNALACSKYIRSTFETDHFHRKLFPELTPEYAEVTKERLVWNEDCWILPGRRERHPQGFVEAAGIQSRMAMRHYKGIFFDDPVNEATWKSHTDIQKAITWLELSKNLLEVNSIDHPRASFLWVTGNTWSDSDVSTYIEEKLPTFRIWHRSCWVCSVCGRNNCIRSPQCSFTEEPLWAERYTTLGLRTLKSEQGPLIFGAQYENSPYNAETCKFSTDKCGYFAYDNHLKELVIFAKDKYTISRRLPLSAMRGFLSFDPATSTDPKSCRSAIVITCEDMSNGDVFLLDLWADNVRPSEAINTFIEKYLMWKERGLTFRHVGFEAVAGQKYVLPALVSTAKLRGVYDLSIEPDNRSDYQFIYLFKTDRGLTKEERISNLLSWRIDAGKLLINKGLPQLELFEYEFNRFPNAKSADVIDALAYCEQFYSRTVQDREIIDTVLLHNESRLASMSKRLPW